VRDLAGHRRVAATRDALSEGNHVRDITQLNARDALEFLY